MFILVLFDEFEPVRILETRLQDTAGFEALYRLQRVLGGDVRGC